MSEDIVCTIKGQRGSPPALTTIASNVLWQLDKRGAVESGGYSQAEPHYVYDGYTTQLPTNNPTLLLEGDLLIDQRVIDGSTGNYRQWRITDDPESFVDHWEALLYRYRGT